MHVRQPIVPLPQRERTDVLDLRTDHHDRARLPAQVHGIGDQKGLRRTLHQLLHEVDPADAQIEDPDALGDRSLEEALGHGHPEAVVAAEDVPHPGDQDVHDPRIGLAVTDLEAALEELDARLRRYPADRYPVQHGTAQYHRGVALADAGRLEEAERALGTAVRLFDPEGLAHEHAAARNSLGAVLRQAGRPGEAAEQFRRAADLFAAAGKDLERGAALHNLGLALRDLGRPEEALARFEEAADLLDPARVPAQAAAATRERGAILLTLGRLDDAGWMLGRALEMADRAGDPAGWGAAANTLGLAHLASGRLDEAAEAFRSAAGAHPRSVRPDGYAMARANLALAYDRAGERVRARLAALQAAGTPGAPGAVLKQAEEVLGRVGRDAGAVGAVLEEEPRDRWAAIVREEVVRWVDAGPADRDREVAAWIDRLLEAEHGGDLAETWLGALLELPTGDMEGLIRSALEAVSRRPGDAGRFRNRTKVAMAGFHVPQLIRLKDSLGRLASDLGLEGPW